MCVNHCFLIFNYCNDRVNVTIGWDEHEIAKQNLFHLGKFPITDLKDILKPEGSSCEILLQTERPGFASKFVSAFEQSAMRRENSRDGAKALRGDGTKEWRR
jgi:hypothetical protein